MLPFCFFLRLQFSPLCIVCLSVAAYSGEIKINIILARILAASLIPLMLSDALAPTTY